MVALMMAGEAKELRRAGGGGVADELGEKRDDTRKRCEGSSGRGGETGREAMEDSGVGVDDVGAGAGVGGGDGEKGGFVPETMRRENGRLRFVIHVDDICTEIIMTVDGGRINGGDERRMEEEEEEEDGDKYREKH